jgi:23S rRNA (guanine745-N1)-methyltransferase
MTAAPPASLVNVVPFLQCPLCAGEMGLERAALRCPKGHFFDVARQGYVNLLSGLAPQSADTPEMVAARARFLGAGHYDRLSELLGEIAVGLGSPAAGEERCLVEVGAGTGRHLGAILERFPGVPGIAIDISKHAARHAARAHPRIGSVVADATRVIPVRTAAAALAFCVFAPRSATELHRILDPRGALVVAMPAPGRHLQELVGPLGMLTVDPRKEERLESRLAPSFVPSERHDVEFPLRLSRAAVADLVAMGPSAHHVSPDSLRSEVESLPEPVEVTASFVVAVLRPRA